MMSSVGNLQLSVGKLRLHAPPTFLTHDAADNTAFQIYSFATNKLEHKGDNTDVIYSLFFSSCFFQPTADDVSTIEIWLVKCQG